MFVFTIFSKLLLNMKTVKNDNIPSPLSPLDTGRKLNLMYIQLTSFIQGDRLIWI